MLERAGLVAAVLGEEGEEEEIVKELAEILKLDDPRHWQRSWPNIPSARMPSASRRTRTPSSLRVSHCRRWRLCP